MKDTEREAFECPCSDAKSVTGPHKSFKEPVYRFNRFPPWKRGGSIRSDKTRSGPEARTEDGH